MTKIPSLKELRKEYASVMECKAVTNVSNWTEPNTDEPFDEQESLERALKNSDALNAKLKEALSL
jgi:hypothetical protein